ncbi:putative polysaccharide biosynthesis protein [Granulicatella seriolae]|uniref:Polysaccharide biosynthesis protein n=1 Tax=Granulicatella seriolae TaxID=2967226 RepID=A0ABT1WLA9_9LACT|nr:polysaccharide biosynthesis protein [Granulicatella seriolae]
MADNQEQRTRRKHGLADLDQSNESSQETMLKSSAWLTAGSMISRLLGALYIIPWVMMMGNQVDSERANALFTVGYGIYGIFLQISTAGFPSAISKLVADYNSRGEYKTSWRLFRSSMWFMLGAGIISGIVMYATAPLLASGGVSENVAQGTLVIRSLVPAVVIIPAMSLLRGYYQGFNDMAPSAISQLIEQVVRIIYMLVMTFMIMIVLNGDFSVAVAHSTFAAFVGAIASMGYLFKKLWQDRPYLETLMAKSKPVRQQPTRIIIFEMIRESIPFVIITSGIQLAYLVDQFSFKQLAQLMMPQLSTADIEIHYALFASNGNKLIMIIISLAVSLAAAAIPLLATYFSAGNKAETKLIIRKNIGLYAFIMFPAAIGMAIVAQPIYNIFYFPNPLGAELLVVSCIMSIILGAYTILSAMLQAIQEHGEAIKGLAMGLLIKVLWQPVCVYFLGTAGPIWATTLAFTVSSVYMLAQLYRITKFDLKGTMFDVLKISGLTALMAVSAYLTLRPASLVLSPERKVTAFIIVILVALVGGGVYVIASLKTRIADDMLGDRSQTIRRKLRIK